MAPTTVNTGFGHNMCSGPWVLDQDLVPGYWLVNTALKRVSVQLQHIEVI